MTDEVHPARFLVGAVEAVGAFSLLWFPPLGNQQAQSAAAWVGRGAAALVVFFTAAAMGRSSVCRVFCVASAVMLLVVTVVATGGYLVTTADSRALLDRVGGWHQPIDEPFDTTASLSTRSSNTNGSGQASIAHGVLTLTLRSNHVANQQYLVTPIASDDFYVETRERRQNGAPGSGCFLAVGAQNSNSYLLYQVAYNSTNRHSARSAELFREDLVMGRAQERPVFSSDPLPYVRWWSLLWPPGHDASWTTLGLHVRGSVIDLYVDRRHVGRATNIDLPGSGVTVGAFDPGTPDGSYVGCEFDYLSAWTN